MLERAPVEVEVPAPRAGWVSGCGALAIGRAAMGLGAGRARKSDAIDPAVGIVLAAKVGDQVDGGAPLARVFARTADAARDAVDAVTGAFTFSDSPVERPALLLETIG